MLCKSALNKVPDSALLPFRFTVNAYRGCSHACRYCFARPTHEYLGIRCGLTSIPQIVVKTNIVDVLRRGWARRSWRRDTVALGTNTDPYQRRGTLRTDARDHRGARSVANPDVDSD